MLLCCLFLLGIGKTVYAASSIEISTTKQPEDKVVVAWNPIKDAVKYHVWLSVGDENNYKKKATIQVAESASEAITETEENGNRALTGTTSQAASIATDGVYIVKAIDYTGDTRGQAWYMDLMCFARGSRDLVNAGAMQKTNY